MLKKYTQFITAFGVIFFMQVFSEVGQFSRLNDLCTSSTSLIMLFFIVKATKLRGRFHKRMFTGLIFSFISSIFFLLDNNVSQGYFIVGISSLMACLLCYTGAFYLDFRSAPELDKTGAKLAVLFIALISIGFYFYIRPFLGSVRLLALAYTLLISFMTMMAAFRNLRVNRSSFVLILAGAALFLLSSVLAAYQYFVGAYNHASLYVMITYMIAQFLITLGTMERKLIHRSQG